MSIRVEGKQKRALETRQNILLAYKRLAAVQPFDEISVAAIAKEAGVGKGSVLAHYSEKLALPAALFAHAIDDICAQLETQSADDLDLIAALMPVLDFIFSDDVYARIMLWEGHEVCADIIEPSEKRLFAALDGHLPSSTEFDAETQLEIIRALLVNAVVMHRSCRSAEEARAQFKSLMMAIVIKAG